MNLIKIRRVAALMMAIIAILVIGNGCAFGNRHLTLDPVYSDNLPPKTATTCKIQVPLPEDARNNQQAPNFVGYVRNGYGMHTADVLADKDANVWVQSCITENLKRAGFNVINGKIASSGLVISTSIRSLVCDAGMNLKATVILDVKLKKGDLTFFNRTFTGKASKTNWMMSAEEYHETLTKAMKQCLDGMMPILIQELEKKNGYEKSVLSVDKEIAELKRAIAAKKKLKKKKSSIRSQLDLAEEKLKKLKSEKKLREINAKIKKVEDELKK